MRAQGAAPGGDRDAAGSAGDTTTLSQLALPAHILRRLEGAGVISLEDWCALGHRRHQIWGVTRRTVERIDALARQVRP